MLKKINASIKYRLSKLFFRFVKPYTFAFKRNFQGKKINNFSLGSTTFINYKNNLFLSNNVYIGHFNFIEASNGVEIGEGVQITDNITITTHSSHNSIRLYGRHYNNHKELKGYEKGKIKIGSFTFVGPHSVIMPGTTIGKGCIVKAYSYVKGEYPDFSIIGGNPAIVVGNTKTLDKKLLSEYPELEQFYNEWAE